jgi:hypothetical protein
MPMLLVFVQFDEATPAMVVELHKLIPDSKRE